MKSEYQDGVRITRPRGKDKMKERFVRTCGYSTKHLRIKENAQTKEVKPKRNNKYMSKTN